MTTTEAIIRDHGDRMRYAARAGYIARGAVFLIIGYFAFSAAFASGEAMGEMDAIDEMAGSGFGTALLLALVLALAAFAAWRLFQVIFDIDGHGTGVKGIFIRTGLTISAFAYGALAFYAATLLIGLGSGGGGGNGIVKAAYEAGIGVWLTYAIAAGMAAAGAAHVVKGAKAGFEKYMNIPADRSWLKQVCQFGLIARGITFFILAGLLVTGAASYRSGDTPGIETALSAMAGWSFGWALLSLTGLGLIAFGIYALAEAAYRRINVEAAA
ncbi:DUF1206 domain-containing protein [Aurantimonas endophytica]|uniref:DUF1206 domain-containing protein n=1 Tax=Aurantimonas endophytica TaxID=1522175 RepID=A0A7W6HBX1_9HYPH|nr:DUF1206 domain-containing protein [Aurantimonas endophytica]MBB4002247.1 hypothetical protein [Aurantimonas endophytica]MCO6402127.1 DUF1206 domain-containing protein [Aurantimonas endophytica]